MGRNHVDKFRRVHLLASFLSAIASLWTFRYNFIKLGLLLDYSHCPRSDIRLMIPLFQSLCVTDPELFRVLLGLEPHVFEIDSLPASGI